MSLRRRVQALVGALVLLLALAVAADVVVADQRDEVRADLGGRLRPARDELSTLLTSLVDQETGQRASSSPVTRSSSSRT